MAVNPLSRVPAMFLPDWIKNRIDGNEANITAINDARGQADGFASLDTNGKVPLAQLPASTLDGLTNKGAFDPSTDTLPAPEQDNDGWFYIASASGSVTLGGVATAVASGDWLISDGEVWARIDQSGKVTSVNGKDGSVVLTGADIGYSGVIPGAATVKAGLDALQGMFDTVTGRVDTHEGQITTLQQGLQSETEARVAAFAAEAEARGTAISTAVDAEAQARSTAITTAVNTEAQARGTAITTAVDAEAQARGAAITAEAEARGNAITAEAQARAQGFADLRSSFKVVDLSDQISSEGTSVFTLPTAADHLMMVQVGAALASISRDVSLSADGLQVTFTNYALDSDLQHSLEIQYLEKAAA